MTQEDVAEVARVERRCFSNPWPTSAYRRELRNPLQNYYIVLRAYPDNPPDHQSPPVKSNGNGAAKMGNGLGRMPRRPLLPFVRRGAPVAGEPRIAGFAGMWIMYDEAHITTIATDPLYRGRHLGELLLVALIEEALRRGATWLTLEVRVSNDVAQRLYRKYGFSVHGTRRRYYSDNGEDAYVMWSRSLKDSQYLDQIASLRDGLYDRLATLILTPLDEHGAAAPDARLSEAHG